MGRKAVKFPVQKDTEFITELRKLVDLYFDKEHITRFGNKKLLSKTIFMFLLYLTPYILMITGVFHSFSSVIICWVFIGMGKAGVGMAVMHDANHRSYSGNDSVNKWMGNTLYMLGGFPPNWKYQHNTLHHGYTNIDGSDEDIATGAYLRISPHQPLLKIHRYQHLYAWFLYGLMTLSWVTAGDFRQLSRYLKTDVPLVKDYSATRLFLILIVSKIFYYGVFIAVPMLILPFAWYWIIVFFLAMHFTSGLILTTIFQTAHVVPTSSFPLPDLNGQMNSNWAIHQLLTTADFAPQRKVLSWLIGGLNYQIEHHLFPNISHVHYPKIAVLVREIALKYGIPYHVQPGFFAAVREHVRMLRMLGREAVPV